MSAWFEMRQRNGDPKDRPFVFQLDDPTLIDHARRLVAGMQTGNVHVMGTIVKAVAPYNPDWRFHLEPGSISFWEIAMEVCDAAPDFVQENLGEVGGATLPGGHWCPWKSYVAAEIVPV